MAQDLQDLEKGTLKALMIVYWILVVIGLGVLIAGIIIDNLFVVYLGMLIPGVFGLINHFKRIDLSTMSFGGKVIAVVGIILMWVLLGLIFGFVKAIQCTKAFKNAE